MAKQNIYDNPQFFEGYQQLRKNEANANTLIEIPALLDMLPDMHGKTVLDLGCGFGEHCKLFVEKGAKKVVGLDISQKMIEVARSENQNPNIEFLCLPMEELAILNQKFDIVVSSLAFHYIEAYSQLVGNIYQILVEDGVLIFSQEHPLVTSHSGGERWTRNSDGEKIHANISYYSQEGERETRWFVEGVQKYHRTFSTMINTLVNVGFQIEKIVEPLPSKEILERYPDYNDLVHRPDFLIVKVKK